ncbi:MAG: hypothetical protein GY719_01080 [bacterium]|nr:hypothetical protein [bacterium]
MKGDVAEGGRSRVSARIRAAAYALFSQLVASPSDAAFAGAALPPDLSEALEQLGEHLPYPFDWLPLAGVAEALTDRDLRRIVRAYGVLFEVGSDGPPLAIREDLAEGRPAGTKEEIVRFYEHFGYRLSKDVQWAPDHLSVELEFLHFLAFKECREKDPEKAQPFQLGQVDFLERHPMAWMPDLASRVGQLAGEVYHRRLFQTVDAFLRADLDWQKTTVQRK